MKLLIVLFFIFGCGKAFTQFGGSDNLSASSDSGKPGQNSDQLAEVRDSTEIGNGNEVDIGPGDGESDSDPVLEPTMVTAAFLTDCVVAENGVYCSLNEQVVGTKLSFEAMKVYDSKGQVIPSQSIEISQGSGLTILVAPEYDIARVAISDQEVNLTFAKPDEPTVPAESLLQNVEGGISNGHFDVDAYSCEGTDKSCLIKHVHEYDVKAGKNGINLLNPSQFPTELGFSQEGMDFCLLVLNAEFSQAAVIKINQKTHKVGDMKATWSTGCESFRLDSTASNNLEALELSFPVDVVNIPNGIKQSEPKLAQEDVNRGGSLIVRYVNPATGAFIKEISIYNHQ
ncbi:MAG: hypothetical protein AB8G05_26195 [Oligoflexales bacterium]